MLTLGSQRLEGQGNDYNDGLLNLRRLKYK